jgi:hypothetical protein
MVPERNKKQSRKAQKYDDNTKPNRLSAFKCWGACEVNASRNCPRFFG